SAPSPAPSTRSPMQAAVAPQQGGGGGGFLRSALATAAGVAGGALLFEGIRGMLGHNPGPFGSAAAAAPLSPPDHLSSSSGRDQLSSADLAQDEGAADDYDLTSDDSGDSGFGSDDL